MRIRIADLSRARAEAALAALAPDNVDFPPGQSMEMGMEGDELFITVSGGAIAQLVATIDEVLAHVQASLEATGQ